MYVDRCIPRRNLPALKKQTSEWKQLPSPWRLLLWRCRRGRCLLRLRLLRGFIPTRLGIRFAHEFAVLRGSIGRHAGLVVNLRVQIHPH
jgi:hypothetical protein